MKKILAWIIFQVRFALMKFYICFISKPWVVARFYASWEEYQASEVYRERLINFGFKFAFDLFLQSIWEQKYHLRERIKKEPRLKWKIYFCPFNIAIPAVLATASGEGFFLNYKN